MPSFIGTSLGREISKYKIGIRRFRRIKEKSGLAKEKAILVKVFAS